MERDALLRGAQDRRGRRAVALMLILAAAVVVVVAVVAAALRGGASGLLEVPARTSMLGYLLGKEDPPWVAAGKQPLAYFEAQSRVKATRELGYWPDVNFTSVRPNLHEERPPMEGVPLWLGNGYGIELINSKDGTVFSGDPVVRHGFMSQHCASSDECQNADVCKDGKCKPAIFEGIEAVEKSVTAAQEKKWPQAAMRCATVEGQRAGGCDGYSLPEPIQWRSRRVRRVYPKNAAEVAKWQAKSEVSHAASDAVLEAMQAFHGYSGAKSFGQAQLRAQLSVLREINSQTATDEKMLGVGSRRAPQRDKHAHSRHIGTLHSADYKLSDKEERKLEDSIFDEPDSRRTLHTVYARANAPKKANAARFQGLAMGGGTPVDLTFGVGVDGEPPYHLQTVAESVRNGLLDPNAPDVLPYTQVGGSGTTGQMTAVGYMQPLPLPALSPPADIKGTVEAAA